MHTFRGSGGLVIQHHGDFSGLVEVTAGALIDGFVQNKPVKLPAYDLLEFAAEYVRENRIAAAKAAKPEELLGPYTL